MKTSIRPTIIEEVNIFASSLMTHLKCKNTAKTSTSAMGKECSEIYYFLHNLSTYSNKEVIDTTVENTSDHHPIRMVFKFEHKSYKN